MRSGSGTAAFSSEQALMVTERASELLGFEPAGKSLADGPDATLVELVGAVSGMDLRTRSPFAPLGGISVFSLVLLEQPF